MKYETDPLRSKMMRAVRRENTGPERRVADICRQSGIHYRRHIDDLPGRPDFGNKRRRWVIFVNGCFWHLHKRCGRGVIPIRNNHLWRQKIAANRQRDAAAIRSLRASGYRVLVVWECQLADLKTVRARIQHLACMASVSRARSIYS